MGWESLGVVGFDLGPLLQGQTSIAEINYYYYYYYVFILSAISPYTTGLKALFNQSGCTGTDPTHK